MSKVKVLAPTGDSEESIPCLCSSFWWLPAILGISWLLGHHFNLYFHLHLAFSPVCLCVSDLPLFTLWI